MKAQRAEGDALGINGTPTLYLNGRKYVLPLNAEMLVWSIQDEILFKQQGTPGRASETRGPGALPLTVAMAPDWQLHWVGDVATK